MNDEGVYCKEINKEGHLAERAKVIVVKSSKERRYHAMIEVDVWGNAGEAREAQNIIETELEGYFPVQDSTPRKWVDSIKVLLEAGRIFLHKIVRRFGQVNSHVF